MVSSSHEALHRIFQQDPGLFARAARHLGVAFPPPVSTVELSTDLTETQPLERRVDTLLQMNTEDGSFLLAVESQGRPAPDKPASWAYYLSYVYAKYRIPPVLLVVCADRGTAEWAARQVDIGPRQWCSLSLRPLVLGPDDVPVIDSPDDAARDIPLTVLSAALHRRDPGADAILNALAKALKGLSADDENTATTFIELTEQGLGATQAAELWRHLMAVDLSFFQSQTAQQLRAEGRAESRAKDLLLLLGHRGVEVSEEDRERIVGCGDPDVLGLWFRKALTATSTAEVFASEGEAGADAG
ncbi:hypothetical protein G3I30_17800 [Actinospica acidiphila]|uniref:hypothetical protein n=1 Tax=unclassified Streptomyces TaxID=2593676 RepID=UPI0013AA094B|nr:MULTISPECIES: hypothetical protein [unclassified Streptomyces]MQL61513.1 hypothetical protein [Streptomyces vinaceus]NEA77828.1 hypothetical protein [Actinospica acidiphila]NUV56880.1 hypothetical protein [Streptomyces coelicolor]MBJ6644399.1 hypothetical protein [Streptomyces sp. BSE7-9]MDH3038142.1 hypothetical protein [Streptomyces sp. TRM75561]